MLRHYVSIKTLKSIYYSLIYPYLSYAILSWGCTYKTNLEKIRTIQDKTIRCMFFCNPREHAPPFYNLLDLLMFDNIFRLKSALFTYQIINSKSDIPYVFTNMLKLVSEQHSCNTRYASKRNVVRPRVNTNYGKFTFEFSTSKIWEEIPIAIKKPILSKLSKNN